MRQNIHLIGEKNADWNASHQNETAQKRNSEFYSCNSKMLIWNVWYKNGACIKYNYKKKNT